MVQELLKCLSELGHFLVPSIHVTIFIHFHPLSSYIYFAWFQTEAGIDGRLKITNTTLFRSFKSTVTWILFALLPELAMKPSSCSQSFIHSLPASHKLYSSHFFTLWSLIISVFKHYTCSLCFPLSLAPQIVRSPSSMQFTIIRHVLDGCLRHSQIILRSWLANTQSFCSVTILCYQRFMMNVFAF